MKPPDHIRNFAQWQEHCRQIRARAADLLQGRIGVIAAAQALSKLAYWTDLTNDEDLAFLVAIDSDTDTLPVGKVRQYWESGALQRMDLEIQRAEEFHRPAAREAAERLVRRFAWALDARRIRRQTGKADMRPVREKTLDELEGDVWGSSRYDSYLVQTAHRLRAKPIGHFDGEELRLMIGQNIGLVYLVPLAIEKLEMSLWTAGDMYPGDLLMMVAKSEFPWGVRADVRERFRILAERALTEIPALQHRDGDGMPDADVPGERLAQDIAAALQAVLSRLGRTQ